MRRVLLRILKTLALSLLLTFCVALAVSWHGLGQGASGERLAKMRKSPQWHNGSFENPQPLINDAWLSLSGAFHASDFGRPHPDIQLPDIDPKPLQTLPKSGLRVTWLGHSTSLIEIEGVRILTDPVWSQRVSPIGNLGPTRFYPPQINLGDLPDIDAVLISHDHYDHLDAPTIEAMKMWKNVFIVPLGVGAHLEYWGIDPSRIVELDWWQSTQLGAVTVNCTPARHASGRSVVDKDKTLWASYSLVGKNKRLFFSGDTGLFPAMTEIGKRFGPFDLAMIEIGQYDRAWPDWHIGPEQAVTAVKMLQGRALLPMHWGLFKLAYHGWTEPVERALLAANGNQMPILTPQLGESIEDLPKIRPKHWWPVAAWQTAAEHPVVSSGL